MTIEERAEEYRRDITGYSPIPIGKEGKDGYIHGATEQRKIDMTLFLKLCERWKKIYLRKCTSPSTYARTIAPEQFNAIDFLLHDAFKEMGIDEEAFIKAHKEK